VSRDVRTRPAGDAGIVALVDLLRKAGLECEIQLPESSRALRIGTKGQPVCRFRLRDANVLRRPITELSLARAYVEGALDIEDLNTDEDFTKVFKVREHMRSGTSPAQALRMATEIGLLAPTRANTRAIRRHYNLPDDFFYTFLDPTYHLYSQCRFAGRDLALDVAARQKLDDMATELRLRPGDRILDIGGGWGGMMEYCTTRGIRVTSLTLSEASAKAIRKRIRNGLGEVLVEDILEHRRQRYYDHVAILGVIEHIPTYARFAQRVWDALKPRGRLYMDASATREKYAGSAFIRRYTWPGSHSCLALPDMEQELIFHGFAIDSVREAGDDYARTMRAWARRFEDGADDVKQRYGELIYRTWRLYLWGGAAAFESNRLQAYTLVARRLREQGPRPGALRRTAHFAASLRR
jgi:cyclopropane-fatty-acyl-phospholipid synthase